MKKPMKKSTKKQNKKSTRNTAKKPKQQSFFKEQARLHKKFFGGALLMGKRKSLRPLSTQDSIHFVLRSRWASGKDSFLSAKNHKVIDRIITGFAKKFGVKIYQRAVSGNHIHLLLKITNRVLYRAFIKAVSGKIASHVMGQQSFKLFSQSRQADRLKQPSRSKQPSDSNAEAKTDAKTSTKTGAKTSKAGDGVQASEKSQSFWEFRPFSRIVNWGRDFKTCVQYLKQNVLEALGFVPYKARKNYYSSWLKNTTPDLNNTTPDLNCSNTS
jgi:REP element-mobilizing transposase RayT